MKETFPISLFPPPCSPLPSLCLSLAIYPSLAYDSLGSEKKEKNTDRIITGTSPTLPHKFPPQTSITSKNSCVTRSPTLRTLPFKYISRAKDLCRNITQKASPIMPPFNVIAGGGEGGRLQQYPKIR